MKISARNQFTGTISEVHTGAVYTEVEVRLRGGTVPVAMITRKSADKLDIKPGREVIALVKAS